MRNAVPLLSGALAAPFAWMGGRAITRGEFLADVLQIAESLPARQYALNLCEDRYLFLVGFAAALVRGETNLLPPNRTSHVISEMAREYKDVYCMSDSPDLTFDLLVHHLALSGHRVAQTAVPEIEFDHVAAILFTSGSTGRPRPNPKRWGELMAGANMAATRLGLDGPINLVATVPSQHMFGLETSVMLPLAGFAEVSTKRPFFPEDVQSAIAETPNPRLLVTTPFHLRTCAQAGIPWPEIRFILSATAPLSRSLADEAERAMRTRVVEIYGSTETGAMATRRATEGDSWRLMDGFEVMHSGDALCVSAPHLDREIALHDRIEMDDNGMFRLLGRSGDVISIAGKRASLGELNHRLTAIEGVEEGLYVVIEPDGDRITRLAALVVAPSLSEGEILADLRRTLDPVFLPRPLRKVSRLPRSETGKIPRGAVMEILQQSGDA